MLFEREFGVTSLATRGGVWIAQEIGGTQVSCVFGVLWHF